MKKFVISLVLLAAAGAALAQVKDQLKIVVAFPAGGPGDKIARILSDNLGRSLTRPVIVENRAGASGVIAAEYVIRNPAPDSTLFLSNGGVLSINPAVNPKLSYDPGRDFKPVTMVADTSTVLVTSAASDLKDAADLKAKVLARKRAYSAASSGTGAASHLSIEMFVEAVGVELLHVPYKGASPAIADVVGGRVDLFFGDLPGVLGLITGGKLKALAVVSDKPSALLPGVKTLTEQGVSNVVPSGWWGVVMPAAASDAAVKSYAEAIQRLLKDPAVVKQFEAMGATPAPSDPAAFKTFLDADRPRWVDVAKRRNIQPER